MADEPIHMKTYDSSNRSRVAHLVGEGMPYKDIAAMLGISIQRAEQLRRQYLGLRLTFHSISKFGTRFQERYGQENDSYTPRLRYIARPYAISVLIG